MKKNLLLYILLPVLAASSCCGPKDGIYRLQLFTTNDVHGCYFDSLYVSDGTRQSLYAVSHYVDSVRTADGAENVILVDAGDCLQGDNAAYYYNYVDTLTPHLYARMANYMGYDAVAVGNHDIETGHPVYDRIARQLDMPFMAANAIRNDNGKPYFADYTIVRKNGLKVAILGFTNPNIKNWLSEELWEGMHFESLLPLVQQDVDKVIAKEHPHVVIVAVHSGTGKGDGSMLESQGLDLYGTLEGVDFLICSHDHRPAVYAKDDICLINSGSHCRNIGHGVITLEVKNGKVESKELSAGLVPVRKGTVDTEMRDIFRPDFEAVRAFTLKPVGGLVRDMRTRDAYTGMCDYTNLLHTLCLSCTPAQISFAAPLTFNGYLKAGTLVYNDLFTIYPFENQLFVVNMTGREIKDYLEFSYDAWINTVSGKPGEHVLKISDKPDPRTGQKRWSFVGRAYNFDSAGGLDYTVDVTAPHGSRVKIVSLADGTPFDMSATYNVAMTSYRASGGGALMREGAGIDTDNIGSRVVAKYPEIRDILYDYLTEHGSIDPAAISAPEVVGRWSFVPEDLAGRMLAADMALLFD